MHARFASAGPVLVLLALCASHVPTQAQPPPGTFFIRGSAGLATQSLTDWRNSIDFQKQALQSAGFPGTWKNIGPAFVPSFEFGYMVSDVVSVGAGVSHQKGTSDNAYADASGSIAQKITASAVGLRGNVAFWPRGGRGFFVGADAGLALGKASDEFHFQDFTAPANDLDITGKWDGSGFIGGVFAGLQRSLGGGAIGAVRAWYQFANLGVLNGSVTSPQLGVEFGPPGGASGQVLETNLSGVGVAVAIGASFRGRS